MAPNDWTPAVLITATVSLVTAGLVWLVAPWGPYGPHSGPGATIPRHPLPPEVVVWTGELAPGLKGVLGPVWGDTVPDLHHDGMLNEDLGLKGPEALAYFRLLVFNTSSESRTLTLDEGELVMLDESGAQVPLRSLAAMVERGEIHPGDGLQFSLRALGALSSTLEVPAGSFVPLLVSFDARVRISTARAVATAQGKSLRRRQMARAEFRRLFAQPDEARVKDL